MEGGEPHDATCEDVDCGPPPPIGACCIEDPGAPGICVMLPEEHCLAEGGFYFGDGTFCDDPNIPCGAPPEPIACCFPDGWCEDMPLEHCMMEGGMPHDGTCETVECN